MESFVELWEMVQEELKASLSEVIYNVWINDLEFISFDGSKVILSLGEFKRKVVEQKFYDVLCRAFEKVLGFKVEVEIIDPNFSSPAKNKADDIPARYLENTFETFVVGSSNKFAHAAAQAVAANPGQAYNPLFIYGSSGLGKTHLLRAICHEIVSNNPNINYLFTHGEDFTNEIVLHLAQKNMAEFHNKYRNLELLIVDDVQFIAGKTSTEEEFFHTFNALTEMKHQIVLSSDRPPKEISTLEDRLRTRFEWGLLADIQPPDLETRMAIIKRKAELLEFDLPDEVVTYIAERLKNNIRQLEGAVKKMQAFVTIHGAPKNTTTAQNAIKDILSDSRPVPVTIERIVQEVARTFGANPSDIRSKKRDAPTSKMRQIAMFVVSEITGLSKEAIGREFGGRDHSTVIYALREIKNEIDGDQSLKTTVNEIMKNIQEEQ
jgi:chromosomal replication initiator protein